VRRHHIGLLALFVALSGTAYATATIGSSDIKSNAIKSRHIRNGQVTAADVNEASLGKVPSADTLDSSVGDVMWAVVQSDGSLVRWSPGVACPVLQPFEPPTCGGNASSYFVGFPRSIVDCAWVASPSSPDETDPSGGFVTGNVRNDGGGPDPDVINIHTAASNGNAANLSFHLIVTCPPA
jgi:hypothetical protein